MTENDVFVAIQGILQQMLDQGWSLEDAIAIIQAAIEEFEEEQ